MPSAIVFTGDNDDQVIAWMDKRCGSPDKLPHVVDHGGWLEFYADGRRVFVHPGDKVTLGDDGWFAVILGRQQVA